MTPSRFTFRVKVVTEWSGISFARIILYPRQSRDGNPRSTNGAAHGSNLPAPESVGNSTRTSAATPRQGVSPTDSGYHRCWARRAPSHRHDRPNPQLFKIQLRDLGSICPCGATSVPPPASRPFSATSLTPQTHPPASPASSPGSRTPVRTACRSMDPRSRRIPAGLPSAATGCAPA